MESYSVKDGIKAFVLFVIASIIPCLFNALPTMTNISNAVIDLLGIIGAVCGIVICLLFVMMSKQTVSSIGLHRKNIVKVIICGLCGAFFLLILQYVFAFYFMGWKHINIMLFQMYPLFFFSLSAIEEEIIFRGYIQTRLGGLIRNETVIMIIVAVLFWAVHYPVMWMVGTTLDIARTIWLIVLGLVCSLVYRITDNIWSAIIVHLFYNVVTFY